MKKVFLALFLPAILSLPAVGHAWRGDFRFVQNGGDSAFSKRIKKGALASVEMHGLVVYVRLTNDQGEVETYVERAHVQSVDCKNDASFQIKPENRPEILYFHLTLEDSEDRKCEMFNPSSHHVLTIASFDLPENGYPYNPGLTTFEIPQDQVDRKPHF